MHTELPVASRWTASCASWPKPPSPGICLACSSLLQWLRNPQTRNILQPSTQNPHLRLPAPACTPHLHCLATQRTTKWPSLTRLGSNWTPDPPLLHHSQQQQQQQQQFCSRLCQSSPAKGLTQQAWQPSPARSLSQRTPAQLCMLPAELLSKLRILPRLGHQRMLRALPSRPQTPPSACSCKNQTQQPDQQTSTALPTCLLITSRQASPAAGSPACLP